MNIINIIKELGRENRVLILENLKDYKNASEIKKVLKSNGISKPYITISRYIESLKSAGLIEKDKGVFRLTSIGQLTVIFIKKFNNHLNIITKHKEFFDRHSLLALPDTFYNNFHLLEKGKLIEDPLSLSIIILEKLKKAKKTKIAVPKVEKELFNYIKKIKDIEIISDKNIDNKSGVLLGVMIVDKSFACLFFPYMDGSLDMTSAFVSSDIEFIEWAERIFQSYQREGLQSHPVP